MSFDHHNHPTSATPGNTLCVFQVDYFTVRAVLYALFSIPEREVVVNLRARPADVVCVEGERARPDTRFLFRVPELAPVTGLALPAHALLFDEHRSGLRTRAYAFFID